MSDNIKLVIEIPKKVFEARKMGEISPWVTVPILDAVQNGIPLDDVKAEMEKQIERDLSYSETEVFKVPCHLGTANGLQVAVRILDNIGKAESIDPNDMTHMFDGVTEIPKDAFKGWTTEELLEKIRAEREEN